MALSGIIGDVPHVNKELQCNDFFNNYPDIIYPQSQRRGALNPFKAPKCDEDMKDGESRTYVYETDNPLFNPITVVSTATRNGDKPVCENVISFESSNGNIVYGKRTIVNERKILSATDAKYERPQCGNIPIKSIQDSFPREEIGVEFYMQQNFSRFIDDNRTRMSTEEYDKLKGKANDKKAYEKWLLSPSGINTKNETFESYDRLDKIFSEIMDDWSNTQVEYRVLFDDKLTYLTIKINSILISDKPITRDDLSKLKNEAEAIKKTRSDILKKLKLFVKRYELAIPEKEALKTLKELQEERNILKLKNQNDQQLWRVELFIRWHERKSEIQNFILNIEGKVNIESEMAKAIEQTRLTENMVGIEYDDKKPIEENKAALAKRLEERKRIVEVSESLNLKLKKLDAAIKIVEAKAVNDEDKAVVLVDLNNLNKLSLTTKVASDHELIVKMKQSRQKFQKSRTALDKISDDFYDNYLTLAEKDNFNVRSIAQIGFKRIGRFPCNPLDKFDGKSCVRKSVPTEKPEWTPANGQAPCQGGFVDKGSVCRLEYMEGDKEVVKEEPKRNAEPIASGDDWVYSNGTKKYGFDSEPFRYNPDLTNPFFGKPPGELLVKLQTLTASSAQYQAIMQAMNEFLSPEEQNTLTLELKQKLAVELDTIEDNERFGLSGFSRIGDEACNPGAGYDLDTNECVRPQTFPAPRIVDISEPCPSNFTCGPYVIPGVPHVTSVPGVMWQDDKAMPGLQVQNPIIIPEYRYRPNPKAILEGRFPTPGKPILPSLEFCDERCQKSKQSNPSSSELDKHQAWLEANAPNGDPKCPKYWLDILDSNNETLCQAFKKSYGVCPPGFTSFGSVCKAGKAEMPQMESGIVKDGEPMPLKDAKIRGDLFTSGVVAHS